MNARRFFAIAALAIAALAIVAVHGASSARADDDLSALLSEPVESTSGKSVGTAAESPALSISVTAEDLRRYGIRTLAEAYNFLTLGLVSQDPLGEPEVGGRGLMFPSDENKHILLLIDGHSTNDQESGASFHGRALGLPIEIIDHIEVVLGPGSVLYGSNAMLGVVNVVTKRAKDYAGIHVVVSTDLSPPLNSGYGVREPAATSQYLADIGKGYRAVLGAGHEFELRGLPAEVTAAFEYYSLDGAAIDWAPQIQPQISFGPLAPRGVWGGTTRNSYYADVGSGYARLAVGEFELATHVTASSISQPYLRRKYQGHYGDFDDSESGILHRYAGVDLKWRHNVTTIASVVARLYGDWAVDQTQFRDHAFMGCLNHDTVVLCTRAEAGYARWVGTELQWTFDWTGNGAMTTLLGGDARLRRVGYQNSSIETATGGEVVYSRFNDTETVGAVYAQHVYRATPWLTMNGGARWDIDDRFGGRFLPRAAVIVQPWSGGTFKAIYSQAFRAPTAQELNFRHPLNSLQSEGLLPESVRSVEAVLEQRFGSQNITFGVFRSWWTQMIVRRELRDLEMQVPDEDQAVIEAAKAAGVLDSGVQIVFQYANVASIDNFGFNGGYDGTLLAGRLAYGLNVTGAYGRLNTSKGSTRLSVTPSLFGNARISYDLANRLPIIALAAHMGDRVLSEAGEDSGFKSLTFAPAAFDLRATIAGPIPGMKRVAYQLMGNYAFAATGPYTAGPSQVTPQSPVSTLVLAPNVRFTLMLGLQINLDIKP